MNYSDIIDSWLNGQKNQFINQVCTMQSRVFAALLKSDETLSDKVKLEIICYYLMYI